MKLDLWCKYLEKNFSNEKMVPKLPVIIRLDGCNFGKWTKGLVKPFDFQLSELMINLTEYLVKETNAIIGYTQSDEITLILYSPDIESSIYNDGKKQKMLSKLTGSCVNFFNNKRLEHLPNHNKIANFDCRIYQTPTLEDAAIQILWRENDATRNSKFMLAQHYFSHKSLQGLNGSQLQDKLLVEKNINWNDLDVHFKRGTYIQKRKIINNFSKEDLLKLPKKHNAHKNPNLIIERNVISKIDVPIFSKIKNKVDFIFNGQDPILYEK